MTEIKNAQSFSPNGMDRKLSYKIEVWREWLDDPARDDWYQSGPAYGKCADALAELGRMRASGVTGEFESRIVEVVELVLPPLVARLVAETESC